MKRLSAIALLTGTTLAFVGGTQTPQVAAEPRDCELEGECTFKKPLLMVVLDDSTAMNQPFDPDLTRWQQAISLVHELVEHDNGYVAETFVLGLLRFGHDPAPNTPGTAIAGDTTGIVDGIKLDVPWYDPAAPDKPYGECTSGDAILAALDTLPAPLGGATTGIGAWTHGALTFAQSYLATTVLDHPKDMGQRHALMLVLTAGPWTDVTGQFQQAPASAAPALVASDLWTNQAVPTYVVALGGPGDQPLVDALASAGGTVAALEASPLPLLDAMLEVIVDIKSSLIVPVCTPGIPRVMLLLDASSSMLNNDGVKALPGEGPWDLVRAELSGGDSVFDLLLPSDGFTSDVFHFGLSVFGSADEQKLLVQYGSCTEDRIGWALDPTSSCVAPGCTDPYASPVQWTFQDGSLIDPPGFDAPTLSHMPRCDVSNQDPKCFGSGNALHLGLGLVESNLEAHRTACLDMGAEVPCNETTPFLNVLITDGAYDSTDAQVQAPLLAMHADGFVTHVIGFGDDVDLPQLAKLADWGSGGLLAPTVATTQDQLEAAFQEILVPPVFDPCCAFFQCHGPGGEEPGESDTSSTSDSSSTGAVDTDTDTATSADTTSADTTSTGTASTDTASTTTANLDDTGITGITATNAEPPTSAGPTAPTSDGPATTFPGSDESGTDTNIPSESASDKGCACSSSDRSSSSALLLVLLGLLGIRRRRRIAV